MLFEFAFAHLRYFLGGDRPSQTTSHAMSFLKKKLVKLKLKSGISLAYQNYLSTPTYATQKI